eukprot:gene2568-5011_t
MTTIKLFSIFFIVIIHLINSSGSGLNTYLNIQRKQLQNSKVITLSPRGWLNRSLKATGLVNNRATSSIKVKEIIYIPNTIPLLWSDDLELCTEDDHMCTILCDQGFVVHCMSPISINNFDAAVSEVMKWRSEFTSARSMAIVAQELSIPRLLTWLAETALPMTSRRVEVGAVVLIDPPPLQSLSMSEGRMRILRRYSESMLSVPTYRRHVLPFERVHSSELSSDNSYNHDVITKEWKGYIRRLTRNMCVLNNDQSKSTSTTTAFNTPMDMEFTENGRGTVTSTPVPLTPIDVLGPRPTRANEVGSVLANRILVMSSDDIRSLPSFDDSIGSSGSIDSSGGSPIPDHIHGDSDIPSAATPSDMDSTPFLGLDVDAMYGLESEGFMDVFEGESGLFDMRIDDDSDEFSVEQENGDGNGNDNDSDPDDWGLAAAEELSDLYRAGAVIRIPPRRRCRESDDSKVEMDPRNMQCQDENDNRDTGDDSYKSQNKFDDDFTCSWHKEVADVIADWLNIKDEYASIIGLTSPLFDIAYNNGPQLTTAIEFGVRRSLINGQTGGRLKTLISFFRQRTLEVSEYLLILTHSQLLYINVVKKSESISRNTLTMRQNIQFLISDVKAEPSGRFFNITQLIKRFWTFFYPPVSFAHTSDSFS